LKAHALLFVLLGFFCGEALAYNPRIDVRRTVKIAEFLNLPAQQLMIVRLSAPLSVISEVPPLWHTLPSETAAERSELLLPSVLAAYDILFVGDVNAVRNIDEQGLLRDFFPIFSEELILVGPRDRTDDFLGLDAGGIMKKIFSEEMPFFSLMKNEQVWKEEQALWKTAGVSGHRENKRYVESSRDDVTALFQAGDESAFALVGEASFAQYRASNLQSDAQPLEKIASTGIFKKCYVCLMSNEGFRKERTQIADKLASWLKSEDAGAVINSFSLGGLTPFRFEGQSQ
jgi:ABC-type tungstate transport system permease subunit